MKRLLSLFLSFVLLFALLPVNPAITAKAKKTNPIENIFSCLDENITVIDHGNGVTEYTLAPAMASMTMAELAEVAGATVTVESQPVYNAAATPDYDYTTGQKHTPIALEQKYLYSLLDAQDKAYYRIIYNAVKNLEEESAFNINMSQTGKYKLYFTVMFDNPDLFYLGNSPTIRGNGDGTSNLVYSYAASRDEYCHYGHNPSRITPELKAKILAKKAVFDNAVNAFISTIPSNAPAVVKERLVYAKILRSSYYNLSAQWNGICEDNWNAYGIICNGYGVCESYSEAFQTLCHAVGIECTGVVGTAGGGHKWNAVKIEGDWYQCDITFDDPIGGDSDEAYCYYFNLTDEQMAADGHTWGSENEFTVPACTATAYSRDNFFCRYEEDPNGKLHAFDNKCDTTCNNCDFTRYFNGHDFDGALCKHCGYRARTGWKFEDNNWYFYRDDSRVYREWVSDAGGPCFVGWDGALVTNAFIYDENGEETCFVDGSGHVLKNAWGKQDNLWFFLDQDGKRLKNCWFLWKSNWYFLDDCGWMATDVWKKDNTGWCYLKSNGLMAKNQWVSWNGDWYFLNANGYMVTNCWKKDSKGWCYLRGDGRMAKNAWVRDSAGWCYVGWDGYCVTDAWQQDGGGWCYLDSNGRMATSRWISRNGVWYYVNASGHRVCGKQKIGNKYYWFDNTYGFWLHR